jgi:hypothetical protein
MTYFSFEYFSMELIALSDDTNVQTLPRIIHFQKDLGVHVS